MFDLIFQNPIVSAFVVILVLSILLGTIFTFTATHYKLESNSIVERIDNLLPQTQCGQCGYPGCKPYAQAIVDGDAINKCPPGGQRTINALANLLNTKALPLDAEHGAESNVKTVAFIREAECIGCTKCIQACPVDAILGAAKQMHTVIVDECTGCDLCVEPCPVDCIDMIPVAATLQTWAWELPKITPINLITSDKDHARGQAA